jgi:hypothetical protein
VAPRSALCLAPFPQEGREAGGRAGRSEQEALALVISQVPHRAEYLVGLEAFGHDHRAQVVEELDRRGEQLVAAPSRPGREVRGVDADLARGEELEVARVMNPTPKASRSTATPRSRKFPGRCQWTVSREALFITVVEVAPCKTVGIWALAVQYGRPGAGPDVELGTITGPLSARH